MAETGLIDHIGIGVTDLDAAKKYYDDLMSVLGLRQWFERAPGDPLNYGVRPELGDPRRATGVPRVRRTLLRDVLA